LIDGKRKKEMLSLARKAITSRSDPGGIRRLLSESNDFGSAGVFVSVNVDGGLRGCIGNLNRVELRRGIVENAVHAAYHDTRFAPVESGEFGRMKIHINVLSEPKPLEYTDDADLMKKIRGKGVIIEKGFYKATFLPMVWEELPGPEEFLGHLCMKAGLYQDAWHGKGVKVYVYESEEFSE
jgi:AmmeMemoRadiSam system protein A